MKKQIRKTACLVVLFLLTLKLFSQTTTFTYTNNTTLGNLGALCNILYPTVTLNGSIHRPLAGGVTYAASTGLTLSTTPNTTPTYGGTAFALDYNFAVGSTYSIAITAAGGSSVLLLKACAVPNLNSFPLGQPNHCSPEQVVAGYSPVGMGTLTTATAAASTTYTIPAFLAGTSASYFVVWASNGSTSSSTFSISQITITKTSPPSFSISPTAVQCGSTTPMTITVNNANNTPNVTYDWNLGPVPNGWIYNSSPAPQFINGVTTNTLPLTPDGCSNTLQHSLAVTVKVNNVVNTTLNSVVTVSDPTMSISGAAAACTTASMFSVTNLPCRANVVWSYSTIGASGSVNIMPVGKQASVQAGTSGSVTLKATITNMCNTASPIVITKALRVGIINGPAETPITVGNNPTCKNTDIDFRISVVPSSTSYTWTKPSSWSGSLIHNPTYRAVTGNSSGTFPVSVSVTNACGAGIPAVVNVVVNNCSSRVAGTLPNAVTDDISKTGTLEGPSFSQATIYPNPSSNRVTIYIPAKKIADKTLVTIFDMSGNIIKKIKPTASTTTIDVSSLSSGTYSIQLFDGEKLITRKIVKQ